jgi:ferredoxin-NADP reductase
MTINGSPHTSGESPNRLIVSVSDIHEEGIGIKSYDLTSVNDAPLPPFTAGAHITFYLPNGIERQYSLCNHPAERHRYVVGVLRKSDTGGSAYLHTAVTVGDQLTISSPRNNFPLVESAEKYLLIAGGIGITPLLSMAEVLADRDADFEMHCCARSPAHLAFSSRLGWLESENQIFYHFDGGDPRMGLDVTHLVSLQHIGSHIYCCGPAGLTDAVRKSTSHWPASSVHFEYFTPPTAAPRGGASFTVIMRSSGAQYEIPVDRSIADVLLENGVPVETSCTVGTCGTCRTRYIAGDPEHNDFVLTDEERSEYVMICCARSKSKTLVLDI